MGLGSTEIIVIILIIVLLFGASQIPKLAKSLGEGLKEFKKAVKDAKENDSDKENKEKIEK